MNMIIDTECENILYEHLYDCPFLILCFIYVATIVYGSYAFQQYSIWNNGMKLITEIRYTILVIVIYCVLVSIFIEIYEKVV